MKSRRYERFVTGYADLKLTTPAAKGSINRLVRSIITKLLNELDIIALGLAQASCTTSFPLLIRVKG